MPSRWAQIVIVLFWLLMTTWLVRRDVLPVLGFGELNYRQLIADRAVAESTHWLLFLDGERLGTAHSTVEPNVDGSHTLQSRTTLSSELLEEENEAATQIVVKSKFHVNPVGRLEDFTLSLDVDGTPMKVRIDGRVEGDEIVMSSEGFSLLPGDARVKADPDMLMLDMFAPMDRMPDLRVGKKWLTRTINPLSVIFSPAQLFGGGKPKFDVVRHEVVGMEPAVWDNRSWQCYVVAHYHSSSSGKTWVRVSDGRVLRRQVPVAGYLLTVELDPMLTTK